MSPAAGNFQSSTQIAFRPDNCSFSLPIAPILFTGDLIFYLPLFLLLPATFFLLPVPLPEIPSQTLRNLLLFIFISSFRFWWTNLGLSYLDLQFISSAITNLKISGLVWRSLRCHNSWAYYIGFIQFRLRNPREVAGLIYHSFVIFINQNLVQLQNNQTSIIIPLLMNKKAKHNYDDEHADLGYQDIQNYDDQQYQQMMPTKKGKLDSLSYFKKSHKYAGKVQRSQQNQQIQNIQQQQAQQQANQDNVDGIKQALIELKNKNKQRSNLLEEDLKAIDLEDRENLIKIRQDKKKQGSPEALQNQLNQFNKLTQVRYYSQKNLQTLKKYPTNNFPVSQSLHQLHKESESVALANLNKLLDNYQKLSIQFFGQKSKISNHQQILDQPDKNLLKNKRLNVEKLWQKFQEQTKQINQRMQNEIIGWSQRTVLLRNSTSKSHYNSLLMQTPVGQAKKAVQDWEKVSKKCQQKRSPFKILFQPEQNLRQNTDKNIYDDLDLLQQVQKNYEQQLQKDDKDFLISDTLKFLQNKTRTKTVKDVDRKASKNRKVRYNVHAKLLNFMPCQTENLLQARDQIVKNLFNKGYSKDLAEEDFIQI